MASQLAIELTLEQPENCLYLVTSSGASGSAPTYAVTGVNLIPEILEFDASYGNFFLCLFTYPLFYFRRNVFERITRRRSPN